MKIPTTFEPTELIQKGLNLHFVFELDELPESIISDLANQHPNLNHFKQLILIGNAGKHLWSHLKEHHFPSLKEQSLNPIDDFTCDSINNWFEQHHPNLTKKIIYPSTHSIALQALGQLAHWHYPSPFLVGINNQHGSWFAYRAAVLSDSQFSNPKQHQTHSPCTNCQSKVCVTQCPAQALTQNTFHMDKCLDYRLTKGSLCQDTCLAREACPAGAHQKYSKEQLQYHYGISLKMIRKLSNVKKM